MDNSNELGGTFDTAVLAYDKMRPGYLDELYREIFNYVHIGYLKILVIRRFFLC